MWSATGPTEPSWHVPRLMLTAPHRQTLTYSPARRATKIAGAGSAQEFMFFSSMVAHTYDAFKVDSSPGEKYPALPSDGKLGDLPIPAVQNDEVCRSRPLAGTPARYGTAAPHLFRPRPASAQHPRTPKQERPPFVSHKNPATTTNRHRPASVNSEPNRLSFWVTASDLFHSPLLRVFPSRCPALPRGQLSLTRSACIGGPPSLIQRQRRPPG